MKGVKKMNNSLSSREKVKVITTSGLLIALSAIGAMIKVQGSIAFDSMPAFFAALFIGPAAGAVVAALGHLLTAITSGFPLTVPLHLVLMGIMAAIVYIFGALYKRTNGIIACTVGTLLNGPVSTVIAAYVAALLGMPFSGKVMFSALVLPLTIASAINIVLAYVVFKAINTRKF